MTDPVRVLLADEQPAVRESVRRVLEREGGFAVCAEADDAASALEAALRERPDVCIIGLRMSGEPLRTITRITDDLPGTAVVVLTVSRSHDDLLEAVRAGAAGYLLKEMNPERIPHAVRGVLDGEAAVPRTLVTRLLKEMQVQREGRTLRGANGTVELTLREWEVLNLLADRLSTAEIAAQLFISPVTVRRHVSRVLAKLGVTTREAAVDLLDEQA
jgi:DNA-binding NarL/FixJ family response regulator